MSDLERVKQTAETHWDTYVKKVPRIKTVVKKIVLAPLIPLVWVMNRIMRRILLESGCWRCRAMIESGSDLGYGVRDWREEG